MSTPADLAGRTAYISGGSSGINLAIARHLGLRGATVAMQSRKRERIDEALASLRVDGILATGYAADVRDFDASAAAMAEFAQREERLDMVVAGAAGNFVSPADKLSANGFETVVAIDLLGTFNIFRAAVDLVAKDSEAAFLAISAPQASVPFPFQAHVNSAKAGVEHLVRSLAVEWGARGIRVNAISPGPIDNTEGMRRLSTTPEARARIAGMIPLRRFGQMEDIAELAHFLLCDRSQYMTGQIVHCDGGLGLMGAALYAEGAQ